jgi:hypothetical protein
MISLCAILKKSNFKFLKINSMKCLYSLAVVAAASFVVSCKSAKPTYLSPVVRNKVVNNGVSLTQLQYYTDRDIELRREITKEEADVKKGSIKIVNGKYIDIVSLSKGTPGICVGQYPDKILVSFETGSNKFLTFGKTNYATDKNPYRLMAFNWDNNGNGFIKYDNKNYHITKGGDAGVKIKAQYLRRSDKVNQRNMQGIKVDK